MFLAGIAALGLDPHVVDLGARIDRRSTIAPAVSELRRAPAPRSCAGNRARQGLVDLLDRVVALLIERIDVALVGGDRAVGNVPRLAWSSSVHSEQLQRWLRSMCDQRSPD